MLCNLNQKRKSNLNFYKKTQNHQRKNLIMLGSKQFYLINSPKFLLKNHGLKAHNYQHLLNESKNILLQNQLMTQESIKNRLLEYLSKKLFNPRQFV